MFDIVALIKAAGYLGVFGIVFAESGLFIGFFFPGDSLLFTAGFLASQGFLNIWVLAIGSFICAVAGDSVGYTFGRRVGPAIFKREDSFWFHRDHLARAHRFYEAHGGKTIILARFMPIVRTFAPIVAGAGRMKYSKFFAYNVVGGVAWAIGMSMLGFFLGSVIPNIDRYLLPIIAGIIFLSVLPSAIHILRDKTIRTQLFNSIKRCLASR